jgi:hypothetical protein
MQYTAVHQIVALLPAGPAPLDTHSIERSFRATLPHLFNAELGCYAGASDPRHRFSAEFGRWLRDALPHVLRKTRKVVSNNLRERPSRNQEWTRIDQ